MVQTLKRLLERHNTTLRDLTELRIEPGNPNQIHHHHHQEEAGQRLQPVLLHAYKTKIGMVRWLMLSYIFKFSIDVAQIVHGYSETLNML